jgi:hypothetical protein
MRSAEWAVSDPINPYPLYVPVIALYRFSRHRVISLRSRHAKQLRRQTLSTASCHRGHIHAMAQLDHVIRMYHVTHPTGEQLLGLEAPRWPDAYGLVASVPDPGLAPKEALAWAFERTQHDLPLIDTMRWEPGACRRSTSPGDVVVLSPGQSYRCDCIGWQPLALPPPGFWTSLVTSLRRHGPRSLA